MWTGPEIRLVRFRRFSKLTLHRRFVFTIIQMIIQSLFLINWFRKKMKCPADEWGEGYKLIILYLLVLFVISDKLSKSREDGLLSSKYFLTRGADYELEKHKKSDDKLKTGFWLIGTSQIWSNGQKCAKRGLRKTS